MEASPGSGGPRRGRGGPRGGGGEGGFRGRGGRGSPFRGRGGRGSPFRGRGGPGGPGAGSPFRGRGGPGAPFRGRGGPGGPFEGRGFRGGRGQSTFRGRGNSGGGAPFWRDANARGGQAPFRGRGGARGSKPATKAQAPSFLTLKQQAVLPEDLKRSLVITNLPALQIQEANELSGFVSEILPAKDFGKLRLFFRENSFGPVHSLTAICVFDGGLDDVLRHVEKLHGQVFKNHHLIVQSYDNSEDKEEITEHCVRVTNLSSTTSEESLWKTFESCGKLGMIHLNRDKSKGTPLEALVNFEKSDSVTKAVKLDGTSLDNSNIKVVPLDWNLSIKISNLHLEANQEFLENELKEYNPIFIKITSKKMQTAFVSFSDKKSYSKALTLNEQEWLGESIAVSPAAEPHKVFTRWYRDEPVVKLLVLLQPFGVVKTSYHHPRLSGIYVIVFESKAGADAALKASPITANGIPCHLCDSELVPARQNMKKSKVKSEVKEEDVKEEGDSEDEEEEEDGEEDDDEEVDGEEDDEEEVDAEDEEEDVEGEDDDEEMDGEEEEEEEDDDEEDDDGEEDELDGSMDVSVSKKSSNGVKGQKQSPSNVPQKRKSNVPAQNLKNKKSKRT